MTHKALFWTVALPALLLALSAQAHEPSKHADGDGKPNCAKMKEMDHSKMDKDDPVMQAMMKKCMKKMHEGETESGKSDKMRHEHKKRHKYEENADPEDDRDADASSKHDH